MCRLQEDFGFWYDKGVTRIGQNENSRYWPQIAGHERSSIQIFFLVVNYIIFGHALIYESFGSHYDNWAKIWQLNQL